MKQTFIRMKVYSSFIDKYHGEGEVTPLCEYILRKRFFVEPWIVVSNDWLHEPGEPFEWFKVPKSIGKKELVITGSKNRYAEIVEKWKA